MSKSIPLLFICLISLNCSQNSVRSHSEKSEQVAPLVGSFQVHKYHLENDLKLLVVEDHSSPTFAYQTWYSVGSRNEVVGSTGLAHLFEHMMFKGTKHHKDGEFEKLMEAAGAEGENAFTSRDYTAYVQELPKEKLEMIVELESERMVNLIVDETAFKTEREVVQNERRFSYENNPDGLMYQELFGIAFTSHPYHWPVIGYEEDLNRMKSEDAYRFYKSFYAPNHATVVVTGDVEHNGVYEMAKKYYSKIRKQESANLATPTEAPQKSPRRKTLKFNVQVEKLLLGYHIPEAQHKDAATLETLSELLSGGKSSRLYQALVNTGVASAVDSGTEDNKDPSLFLIEVNLQKNKKAAHAENIILREINRLMHEIPSKKELEKIKNRISFSFYEHLNNNNGRARFLGKNETLLGNFEEGIKTYQASLHVTGADLQRVAVQYFFPENRSVIIGVPK